MESRTEALEVVAQTVAKRLLLTAKDCISKELQELDQHDKLGSKSKSIQYGHLLIDALYLQFMEFLEGAEERFKTQVEEDPITESSTIPETLEEAFIHLDSLKGKEEFIKHGPASFHHGLGRWLRNNWGFWTKEGKLYEYLVGLGLEHPDDMSGLILESYHRKLLGKPLDVEGQVKYYQDYWEKAKCQK